MGSSYHVIGKDVTNAIVVDDIVKFNDKQIDSFNKKFVELATNGDCHSLGVLLRFNRGHQYPLKYAFYKACEKGHVHMAELLRYLGADIFGEDNLAARLAVHNRHYNLVVWLIENGLDISYNDYYLYALAYSVGDRDITNLMYKLGADPEALVRHGVKSC